MNLDSLIIKVLSINFHAINNGLSIQEIVSLIRSQYPHVNLGRLPNVSVASGIRRLMERGEITQDKDRRTYRVA